MSVSAARGDIHCESSDIIREDLIVEEQLLQTCSHSAVSGVQERCAELTRELYVPPSVLV